MDVSSFYDSFLVYNSCGFFLAWDSRTRSLEAQQMSTCFLSHGTTFLHILRMERNVGIPTNFTKLGFVSGVLLLCTRLNHHENHHLGVNIFGSLFPSASKKSLFAFHKFFPANPGLGLPPVKWWFITIRESS